MQMIRKKTFLATSVMLASIAMFPHLLFGRDEDSQYSSWLKKGKGSDKKELLHLTKYAVFSDRSLTFF